MALLDLTPASFTEYRDAGGGRGLERALGLSPDEVIAEVRDSGLRGRGGAGFPTGVKWGSVREAEVDAFVCNAAEGEPATFKDRYLMRRNPYLVLEGIAIAAHAVGVELAHIGLKEAFSQEVERIREAIGEMGAAGGLGGAQVEVFTGPDHFLLGEETGLVRAMEGEPPMPTGVPTFVRGGQQALGAPVGVNNVETLANVPHILAEGPDWLRQWGTDDSPGTVCVTIAGDVQREGVYEVPMGTPLSSVISELAGGPKPGHEIAFVVPGASHRVVTPERIGARLDHSSMDEAGSSLGAAGFAVFDDSACPVRVAMLYGRFLHVESCGQCNACKEHSGAIWEFLGDLEAGRGTRETMDEILARAGRVQDGRKCELPTGTRHVVESFVRLFPDDFEAHVGRECPSEREVVFPKIADLDPDLGFVYDERYGEKRADWGETAAP